MVLPVPSLVSFDVLDPTWRQIYLRTIPSVVLLSLPYLWELFKFILPRPVKRVLVDVPASFLAPFLTLDELYPQPNAKSKPTRPLYAHIVLSGGALVHSLGWLGVVGWKAIASSGQSSSSSPSSTAVLATSAVLSALWLYTAVLPLLQPRQTPHPSLLVFTFVQAVVNVLTYATALFKWSLVVPGVPHPTLLDWRTATLTGVALAIELAMIAIGLGLKLQSVPVAFLEENEKVVSEGAPGSSKEDMTTVWGWMTFHWVNSLVEKGKYLLFIARPESDELGESSSRPARSRICPSRELTQAHPIPIRAWCLQASLATSRTRRSTRSLPLNVPLPRSRSLLLRLLGRCCSSSSRPTDATSSLTRSSPPSQSSSSSTVYRTIRPTQPQTGAD